MFVPIISCCHHIKLDMKKGIILVSFYLIFWETAILQQHESTIIFIMESYFII